MSKNTIVVNKVTIFTDNHDDIDLFIRDNLKAFNESPSAFEYNSISSEWKEKVGTNVISATEIRNRLNERYRILLDNEKELKLLEIRLMNMKASTKKATEKEIKEIATDFGLYKTAVKNHFINMIKKSIVSGFFSNKQFGDMSRKDLKEI